MSNHKNLVFFNKEGDYLNFNYNSNTDRFEGDILFHENSSDTYKTAGVYMLEKIDSFEYEVPGELTLNKFQLFNEYGLHFYGAKWSTQSITKIEPVNNDASFYSKWVYGLDFETKFPIGSMVQFDSPFLEFVNLDRTYCVVSSKKNGIMIISEVDNATFESIYFETYTDSSAYLNKTLTGVNLVGVYNYVDNLYNNKLSSWSEPDFYDKFYLRKKLNIIGSEKNDGVVTVTDTEIIDPIHFEYTLKPVNLPNNCDLIIEVLTKMDLPKIYESEIQIVSLGSKVIFVTNYLFPRILKPGASFKITGSVTNEIFMTVADVPNFEGISNTRYYELGSQVYYNNKLYECVLAYTHSYGSASTSTITPLNPDYWGSPTYVSVNEMLVDESILNAQVYLTTDRFYYGYSWTYSSAVTMASAAEKFKTDLLAFNVDLYYDKNTLKADLKYPSRYAEVNFYHTKVGPTYSIGSIYQTNERLVRVRETLNYELNYNISSNFKYNIVFTDIDEYGLKIVIDKQVYDVEAAFVYTGLVLDMARTIDRTLRNWLTANFVKLYVLGIEAELAYIGNIYSPFYNSIKLKTTYPNVPLNLTNVLVGSTANYVIEHSRVLFNDLGPFLNININGQDYGVSTIYGTNSQPKIAETLAKWTDEFAEILLDYKFIITNINNLLKFDVKEMDRRLDYKITTGKLIIPGVNDFTIYDKLPGNFGMLITSNEVALPEGATASFEADGFATGMVITINNTVYPYNNQQFNVQFLDPGVMDLSYEGPFWAVNQPICNSSPFATLAFNLGFGQTACDPIIGPTAISGGGGGPYDIIMFDEAMFSYSFNPNEYLEFNYNLGAYSINNIVDLTYVQLSNSIFVLGNNVVSFDSFTGEYLATIELPGNTQSMSIVYNPVNNYLYCLSKQQINVIDPLMNSFIGNISLTFSQPSALAFDIAVNPINGDVYVTYENVAKVDIFAFNNFTSTVSDSISSSTSGFPVAATRTGKMAFNEFEGDFYITTDANKVIRVNGGGFGNGTDRTIQTTFGIPGLTHSIFYEPVNESVYVYGSASLWKIDNGLTQSLALNYSGFNDIIFNNLVGNINISDESGNFTRLDLSTNSFSQSLVANWGYLALNGFDGDVYLSSQNMNNIIVVNASNGTVIHTAPMAAQTTKIIYNPDRKSIFTIQPSINNLLELQVQVNNFINLQPGSYSQYSENQYGTLDPNYRPKQDVWLKSEEYVRRPRENFEGESTVKYYWRWMSDNIPEFFMYDVTGEQLPVSGSYAYTGPKPLTNPSLNRLPNKDLEKVSASEYQQTIFDKVEFSLSYIDDEDDVSSEVTPMQLFLGFKSDNEGAYRSVLQLYKKEEVQFSLTASATSYIKMETLDPENASGDKRGIITLFSDSEVLTDSGFKVGQLIVIYNKDITNQKNQYISNNNGFVAKIREIFTKYIIIDFFNKDVDFLYTEISKVSDYPKTGVTTFLNTKIKVLDKEIGRFFTYGQTEIEDIRFKIELQNVGKLIAPNEVFIFKDYDINEGATDWIFLNSKRKEMLMMKNLIYPYIGAYKSIINAINYFGYNDLQLNEYYRDINTTSPNFGKLFKIEIPDIFDNTVEGWKETEFVKGFSEDNYEVTNLFNLTYFITDKDGNNILNYSLDEVIIKLQGLKYWLKRNIIPITHKILDITGRAFTRGENFITHRVQEIRAINHKENHTPITFRLNEAYLMPVNSGSTVYNCVIDFYSIVPIERRPNFTTILGTNSATSSVLSEKLKPYVPIYNSPYTNDVPKPYNGVVVEYPDYFNLKIRSYKTYSEWNPFIIYDYGDRVTYYGVVYESATASNKLKNPRKYDNTKLFSPTDRYKVAEVVKYSDEVYVYSGLGATFSGTQSAPTPFKDPQNWLKITEWKRINLQPVQYVTEYRKGDDLRPFNFTVDANIDPFIVIELTTDNGYGCIYTHKKNYEIRGLKDITQPAKPIDPIGPFRPITPLDNTFPTFYEDPQAGLATLTSENGDRGGDLFMDG